MEFILYSIALILLFLLFIPVMRENGISLRNGVEVIFFGIQISVIIVIKVIAPTIERAAGWNDWKAVEAFFGSLFYDNYFNASILILSFICIILIILLSLLKGIDK